MVTKKSTSYRIRPALCTGMPKTAFDNVDNSGRPLMILKFSTLLFFNFFYKEL